MQQRVPLLFPIFPKSGYRAKSPACGLEISVGLLSVGKYRCGERETTYREAVSSACRYYEWP